MYKKSLEEITDEVVDYYDKGTETEEISKRCSIPEYLVQSILVATRNVYFR